jgi:hypothetical protein
VFKNKTVFILGAGASWDYGYPTGEELVKRIIGKATCVAQYLEYSMKTANKRRPSYLDRESLRQMPLEEQWKTVLEECQKLEAGLKQVNPLVIDYYLGWNPSLQPIGKLLIAWVILECEWTSLKKGTNVNRLPDDPKRFKDDWCRFITHELAINCKESTDLSKNDVRFVSFNYDASLELALYEGLSHIEQFEKDDIEGFLGDDRILHVYGAVRDIRIRLPDLDWDQQNRNPRELSDLELELYLPKYQEFLNYIYDASKRLTVIDPHDKTTYGDILKSAREAITAAKFVYILGYGFDQNNNDRLQLPQLLNYQNSGSRFVFFTNYQDIN